MDFLLDRCFKLEREEMETMETVNKLLLQNVLPLHVAAFFLGKTYRNQVKKASPRCTLVSPFKYQSQDGPDNFLHK